MLFFLDIPLLVILSQHFKLRVAFLYFVYPSSRGRWISELPQFLLEM